MSDELSGLSDGDLVARTLDGSQSAFRELMRRHREPIYRMVRSHIGDPDEALDLVQETLIAAHRALDRFDPTRSFRAWLSRIALNKCRDWGRRRAVRSVFSFALPIENAAFVMDYAPAVDTQVGDRRELDRVSRAIAALPTSLKEPLILRTIEGLSQAEAAAALSISEKALEMRLYRARARLAEMLALR